MGDLENWLIPGPEQGKYKISLDNLIVPEHKVEVKNDGDYEKDTVATLKGFPLSKQKTI